MTSEVKLLTVQMAEALGAMSPEARVRMLRERGLIAQEPVDPLRVEAEALVSNWVEAFPADTTELALAALRRGMELRPPLTREMVREAIIKADPCCLAKSDFRPTSQHLKGAEAFVDALHAALTDGGCDG